MVIQLLNQVITISDELPVQLNKVIRPQRVCHVVEGVFNDAASQSKGILPALDNNCEAPMIASHDDI